MAKLTRRHVLGAATAAALAARLRAELNSGTPGIDIVQWTAPFAGWLGPHMADHDKLIKQNEGKNPDFAWDDFLPAVRDMTSYQGQLLGIPYRVTLSIMHYQKQLLADVGFTKAPGNWQEFQDATIAATKAGAPNRYGLGIWGRPSSAASPRSCTAMAAATTTPRRSKS
jgi:multiple sugar transport system substrate-binding protein